MGLKLFVGLARGDLNNILLSSHRTFKYCRSTIQLKLHDMVD